MKEVGAPCCFMSSALIDEDTSFAKNHVPTWIPAKPKSIVTVSDFIFDQSEPRNRPVGGTRGGLPEFWTNQGAEQLLSRASLWKGAKTWQRRKRSFNIWDTRRNNDYN